MKKFVDFKKISIDSTENLVIIENWQKYQSEYLRQKPYRSPEKQKENCNKVTTGSVTKLPVEESRVEESRVDKNTKSEESPEDGPHFDTRFEFLKRLRILEDDFNVKHDDPKNRELFEYLLNNHRALDPIRELDSIIAMWKKKPDELRIRLAAGRTVQDQLYALFKTAAEHLGVK
jgi:hypothetical protein